MQATCEKISQATNLLLLRYHEIPKLQTAFKKEKLLRNIRRIYLKEKGFFISLAEDGQEEIDVVRENADKIFDNVIEKLMNLFSEDNDGKQEIHEDIIIPVSVIAVDAFLRCKILEMPIDVS